MVDGYAPERGDIVWLTLDPTLGHEQGGRRPVIAITRREYNRRSGLMLAVPITSRQKSYPFELPLPLGLEVTGVILVDQLRSISWERRDVSFIAHLPEANLISLLRRCRTLLD